MGQGATITSMKRLGALFERGALGRQSDPRLIERFLAGSGDEAEAAFEVLVARHGPMVQSLCRMLLGEPHAADDAFQATFLVLARRAGSIRDRDALASWLYGVACRVARKARGQAARQRTLERRAASLRSETFSPSDESAALGPVLFEEVGRLPERYRAAIVLCYIDGKTHQQAAGALRCPVRTLQTRLQRGKARLRRQLVRRGVAPLAAMMAALDRLSEGTSKAAASEIPEALIEATSRAAIRFAAPRALASAPSLRPTASPATLALEVIQDTTRHSLRNGLAVAGCGMVGLAWLILALAAGRSATESDKLVTGLVLDANGKPVAGASVWMPTAPDETDTPQASTDASGRYRLSVPAAWDRIPMHQRQAIVWAYAPGHQIATASAYEVLQGKARSVDLTLGPATDTSFLVLGPDGRPVAGAVVEPYHIKTPSAYDFPPKLMQPVLRAVTDAGGRASLPAVSREGFLTVQVTAGSLGSQQLRLLDKASEPAQRIVRLRPAARVEGRLLADRPEQLKGLKIYSTTSDSADRQEGQNQTTGSAEVVADERGMFTIPSIATGSLQLGVRLDEALPVRPRFPESLVIRPGGVNHVDITMEKAVRVRGVIRIKGSGKPVPGASVHVYYGSAQQGDTPVTDAEGRYESHVLAGDVRMQIIAMPQDLVQLGEPWNERHKVPSNVEVFDLPAIELVPGRSIKGRLVRGQDQPVAKARIAASAESRLYGYGMSDAKGEFTLTGVPEGFALGYKAWVEDTVGWVDAAIVRESPLLLRVGRDVTAAPGAEIEISGTVVDPQGKPLAAASVTVTIETGSQPGDRPGSTLVTHQRSKLTTDANGRYAMTFSSEKGKRFRAVATPEKRTIAGTAWVDARGDQPVRFAPLRVMPLGSITGRVVDTAGRPVAAATVFNWGNPVPLTSVVTAPDGAFQLDGLPPGEFRLSVEAPGYRFLGEVHQRDESPLVIKLRRDDEPPARKLRPRGPVLDRAASIELARKVIAPYSDRILEEGGDAEATRRILEVLARIDPDAAWRKCQAGEAPWNHNTVRIAVVHDQIRRDFDSAAAIIPTITSNFWRNWTRFELFDAIPAGRGALKDKLLGEALRDARREGDPGSKAALLMRIAQRMIDQRQRVEARRLVDEALPLAKTADARDERLGCTRMIVGNLARLDLKAAEALIPAKGDERTINDLRGLIGQSIAAENPAGAERILGQMTWNNSHTYTVHACARMARVDLARARGLAETIKLDVLRGYAQGKMADAVAAKDPTVARELLDDSFRSFTQVMSRGFGSGGVWGPDSAAFMSAALLPVVERVEPDRLGEAVARVAALRWYPRTVTDISTTTPDTSSIESIRASAALAALLVRYDRTLAQSIARPIIDHFRAPLSDLENRYLDRYGVFPMLTLADPSAMAELVEVLPERQEADLGQSRDTARVIIAGALAAPESEFWTTVRRSVSDLEIVERDD
jgi:RNA polymerase sigma factor (sigma-70 family)